MATLTVGNLDEDLVRRLYARAEARQSTPDAEVQDILRRALAGDDDRSSRQLAAERLAEFRRRTADRGSPSVAELLEESRSERMRQLTGLDPGG